MPFIFIGCLLRFITAPLDFVPPHAPALEEVRVGLLLVDDAERVERGGLDDLVLEKSPFRRNLPFERVHAVPHPCEDAAPVAVEVELRGRLRHRNPENAFLPHLDAILLDSVLHYFPLKAR